MANPDVRHAVSGIWDYPAASVTLTVSTTDHVASDVLYLLSNADDNSTGLTIGGTFGAAGLWTQQHSSGLAYVDGAGNKQAVMLYSATVGAKANTTFTVTAYGSGGGPNDGSIVLLIVQDATAEAPSTTPVDTGDVSGTSSSVVCPSVSPTLTNDLLVAFAAYIGSSSTTTAMSATATPAMTTQRTSGSAWAHNVVGWRKLTTSGPTGTETFTTGTAHPEVGMIFTVAGPSGTDSGPNYIGTATDLGGGSGSWSNVTNAQGAPDTATADWTSP